MKSLFKRQSLKRKLLVLLMVISCSVLLLATLGFAVSDWISSRGELYDRMRSQGSLIGNNTLAALVFGDTDAAQQTLATLSGEDNVVAAALFDHSGQSFATYRRGSVSLPEALPKRTTGELDGVLYILQPVIHDHETIGHIMILSELSNWQQQQVQRMMVVLGLFLVSVLVASILSDVAQGVVTGPILNLARTARRITETRNYELRAEKLSQDEIGNLADDFNEMLNQIQLRDEELRSIQAHLEEKVQERTAELEELTRQLEHQAFHDTLTELSNRATFDNNLITAIHYAQRHKSQLAVMFLDLDRFKEINDTLGHGIGDKLLIEMSARLRNCLRESDNLARLGGDEFAVLLMDASVDGAAEVAQKLVKAISHPANIDGYHLQVSTSIGISLFPEDGTEASALLKNADTAMYHSKELGGNQFNFYVTEMNQRTERRMLLESKLRCALTQHAFTLHYQPKWDSQSLRMTGVEALIRWFDDEEGFISPAEFIPLAEDCGLISEIDDWVTHRACQDLLSLYGESEPQLSLAVNLSPALFIKEDVYRRIARTLEETGFPAHKLELEVTETLVVSEVGSVYEQLSKIRNLGVEIAIDDFGVAYSSLSRLKQLPLNTLKIDRSFIQDIGTDPNDEVIVRTIIDMAHNLNLKVVAEGVETEQQYQFVKNHLCNQVQGYLFSKPVPLCELAVLLRQQDQAPGPSSPSVQAKLF
ncbi:putative bifunctional diguanylate cyclase/phosphodiesterase [Marinobacterium sediminicola]|uniref:Diguanylate cyclase (GGDEF) domain-containing protein n=1 Tax=Marinobacterium sediminicola TaxID=518898 RepID=A0ABY1S029_9GAMM|nr:EAL domain-containing protein [Marinobacterium sediminicola]ULG69723.1 EAL domain-containing protein [Marinobacterium sediminicola]SMR74546.1 diguanylate cyclase (GGDEF) domain-containing protein [Marinobacterium sediminicola]